MLDMRSDARVQRPPERRTRRYSLNEEADVEDKEREEFLFREPRTADTAPCLLRGDSASRHAAPEPRLILPSRWRAAADARGASQFCDAFMP